MPARAASRWATQKRAFRRISTRWRPTSQSLNAFASSPLRQSDGSLTAAATAGRTLFAAKNCASCHGGTAFTNSAGGATTRGRRHHQRRQRQAPRRRAHGHRRPDASRRLGDGALPAPGSGRDARRRDPCARGHQRVRRRAAEPGRVRRADRQPGTRARSGARRAPGTGLLGQYFNNMTLTGSPVLERTEGVNFTVDRLARHRRQRKQVLGALDRLRRGHGHRHLPVPDPLQRRRPAVGQRQPVIDHWTQHATATTSAPTSRS